MASQAVFDADLARFDAAFKAADAIVTEPDGFTWIDETRVPAGMVDAYAGLRSYGYANGLIVTERASVCHTVT